VPFGNWGIPLDDFPSEYGFGIPPSPKCIQKGPHPLSMIWGDFPKCRFHLAFTHYLNSIG
jgi:hypothetical protein